MSQNISLIKCEDILRTGHLFCKECSKEIDVVLDDQDKFVNPQYTKEWDEYYHYFHPVKFIYPVLLKILWDKCFVFCCPYCACADQDKYVILDNSLFDIKLIQKSFMRSQ